MDNVEWTVVGLLIVLVLLCSVAVTWTMVDQANCKEGGGVPFKTLCLAPEALHSVQSGPRHTNCEQNKGVDNQ